MLHFNDISIFLLILISSSILFLTHPIPMGISLILITLNLALTVFFCSNSSWFSYILFIVMIGGVLILFLYMASLVTSENISMKFLLKSMMISLIIFLYLQFNIFPQTSFVMKSISSLFMIPSFIIIMILAVYLLISLMIVVFITKLNKGPLRSSL